MEEDSKPRVLYQRLTAVRGESCFGCQGPQWTVGLDDILQGLGAEGEISSEPLKPLEMCIEDIEFRVDFIAVDGMDLMD